MEIPATATAFRRRNNQQNNHFVSNHLYQQLTKRIVVLIAVSRAVWIVVRAQYGTGERVGREQNI